MIVIRKNQRLLSKMVFLSFVFIMACLFSVCAWILLSGEHIVLFFGLILPTVSIVIIWSAKRYLIAAINHKCFPVIYDFEKIWQDLGEKMRRTVDIDEVNLAIEDVFRRVIGSQSSAFYISSGDDFVLSRQSGFAGIMKVFAKKRLPQAIFDDKRLVSIEKFSEKDEIFTIFSSLGAETMIPVRNEDVISVLIIVGRKESGRYDTTDAKLMKRISRLYEAILPNLLLFQKLISYLPIGKEELKRKIAELSKAKENLAKLDSAKSEFISIASHQLRTPLTVIKGYVSMIQEGNFGPVLPGHIEPLEKIFASNERLIRLVESLLVVSRIESGRLQYTFSREDLVAIAEESLILAKNMLKKNSVRMFWAKPEEEMLFVDLDREKIKLAIGQILDNAVRYTKQGTITMNLRRIGDMARLSISDTGLGIEPEEMSRLFEKFSRGEGTFLVYTEGTGLGLFIARQIIESHHGKIWAESQGSDRGSKFVVELPLSN